MATHHWIIICGIKHHVQVGITAGCGRVDRVKEMRMVMLMKTITAAMVPPRERGRGYPPCASSSMAYPLDGSGPRKRDEDGDVDEDDHRGDDSPPDGTPVPPRERRRGSPPCASSSMAFPLWSLAFMAMMAPPRSSSMASGDDGPLRQGAREGLD